MNTSSETTSLLMLWRNQENVGGGRTSTTHLLKIFNFVNICWKIHKNSIVGTDQELTIFWESIRVYLSHDLKKVWYICKMVEHFSPMKSVIIKIVILKQYLAQKAVSFLEFPFIDSSPHSFFSFEFVS